MSTASVAALRNGARRRVRVPALLLVLPLAWTAGCVSQAPPAPAAVRDSAPPWDAPRDAVSYLEAAGLEPLPLDLTDGSRTVTLSVTVDGAAVEVPPYIGVDRLRSLQAAVHTHDTSGTLWLEGKGADQVTLGQLFTLWGVRLDQQCLGAACGGVRVTTSPDRPVSDPRTVPLAGLTGIAVAARTS